MRLDSTQLKWAQWTAALFVVSAASYVPYALLSRSGPRGGSIVGLVYGSAGYGLMVFAALLSFRKKYTIWRMGRAQTWTRGHIWLGFLSYPLILFHAGFHWGGSLTRAMMWMFTFVIVTGILGAALQHYMPRLMTEKVPFETIYYQIDRVQGQLLKEADELLTSVTTSSLSAYGVQVPSSGMTRTMTTTLIRMDDRAIKQLKNTYEQTIKPYLRHRGAYTHPLNDRRNSKGVFAQLRTVTPASIHTVVDDIENICEEKRDLDRQSRLHRLLHGWLLVHIPLSYALILLGAIHAVMALRY